MIQLKVWYRSKQVILNRGNSNGWETSKCSISIATGEIQIQTTLRFHFTSVIIAKINNTSDSSCRWLCGRRGIVIHCWREYELINHCKNQYVVLHKDENGSTSQFYSIPLYLGLYIQRMLYPTTRTLTWLYLFLLYL